MKLLPPRSIDQGIDYFNGIVEINLASRMGDGIMRVYQQASSLSLMPVNLVGVAISNAAFPRMTERLAEGRVDLFQERAALGFPLDCLVGLADCRDYFLCALCGGVYQERRAAGDC